MALCNIQNKPYGTNAKHHSRWSYNASSRAEAQRRYLEKNGTTIKKWIILAIDSSVEDVILLTFKEDKYIWSEKE